MRRFALFTAIVFAILLALVLAWRLSDILLILVASIAVAATLRAPIDWFVLRRVPRGLAILLVYVGAGLAALGLLVFLFQHLGDELAAFSEDLSYLYSRLRTQYSILWQFGPGVSGRFPTPEQMTKLLTDRQVGSMERALIGAGQNLTGWLADLALVLILSIYWTADRLRFERLTLSLLPGRHRSVARRTWRTIESELGRYLRSELLQSLLAGMLLTPVFMLLDLRWAVFWALAASLAWLIPLIGSILVIVPMAIIVWIQSGPQTAILAITATVAVLALLEFGLEPRLYTRERGANVLTIMVALVMADAFGLPGLLLAPPIAAIVHILLTELARPRATQAWRLRLETDIAGLETRLAEVRIAMTSNGDSANRRLENLADRLEVLLTETKRL